MKRPMLLMLQTVFLFGICAAQIPDTLWSKILDITNDIDEARSIRQTGDGGFIIAGSCVPDGMTSFTDVLLLKTDASGNVEWARTYGQGFFEQAFSVGQTNDGGYFAGGILMTGVYPFIEPPVSDAWLLKTDPGGDTLWTRKYGGEGNDYCTSVQQTTDQGFILTGAKKAENCNPVWEVDELIQPDTGATWLVKTDPEGDVDWTRSYYERSNGNYVIQVSGGGYLVTGCIFPDSKSNQSDVLLIRTDEDGDTVWTRAIGSQDLYEVGFCVRETPDGYIVSGQSKEPGHPYNALLVKTGFNGEVLWTRTFGSEGSDAAFNIEVAEEGYYGSGSTNGTWWVTNSADMWIFHTDPDGNLLWEQVYDINTCDIGFGGALCEDRGYAIAGMTSYGFGGNIWLARLCPEPAGIADRDDGSVADDVVLYQNAPNPFSEKTTISFELKRPAIVSLSVYDAAGSKVETALRNTSFQPGVYSVELSADRLAGGFYTYHLATQKGSHKSRKMCVVK
ncbi:MAG: hypothetical protein JW861_03180 [Bacteroidales bacterium]|nr:hypothetical protein [Bacteroidales bacterium]